MRNGIFILLMAFSGGAYAGLEPAFKCVRPDLEINIEMNVVGSYIATITHFDGAGGYVRFPSLEVAKVTGARGPVFTGENFYLEVFLDLPREVDGSVRSNYGGGPIQCAGPELLRLPSAAQSLAF